jgi:ornithine cyclodeaminase/alanine dehydrogenase-like protein (mu-crystallin family)
MVLHLSEDDVKRLLTMNDCITVLDDLFRQEARGAVENMLTQEFAPPQGFFRLKSGAMYESNIIGFKIYGGGVRRRLVFVWELAKGLVGIVDALALTQVRTGAMSGLATRYMARPESATVGIIGTGKEARTQVEALNCVRPLRKVRAYSRSPENRHLFATEMTERLGIEVEPVESAEESVKDADIVVTATSANQPVLEGKWLAEGTHVCAIGATTLFRRELDEEAVARSATVVVEHLATAEAECGELIYAATRAKLRWSTVRELKDIVAGDLLGRNAPADITLFDSIGVGAEDVAVAVHLLERARAQSIGRDIDI